MAIPLYKDRLFWLFMALTALLTIGLFFSYNIFFYYLLALLLFVLFIFFLKYPQAGIYLIAFLFPFNYLEFVYSSLNVPYVDLVALMLFAAWLVRSLNSALKNQANFNWKYWPGWLLMLLFVIASLLSLLNVDHEVLS
jgi:hypothetical protein